MAKNGFSADRLVIGSIETVAVSIGKNTTKSVDLRLKAKVDTGADTSSLHARKVKLFHRDGQEFVKFFIPTNGPINGNEEEIEALLVKKGRVKSSDGDAEGRYFVEATICAGKVSIPILLSLNDRSGMRYPMLLGRKFLKDQYIVDVSRQFVLGSPTCSF